MKPILPITMAIKNRQNSSKIKGCCPLQVSPLHLERKVLRNRLLFIYLILSEISLVY